MTEGGMDYPPRRVMYRFWQVVYSAEELGLALGAFARELWRAVRWWMITL